MDILLMGCSYAVPNYFGPPSVEPKYHLEYLLRSHGHRVHNCGINGGSNLQSLSRAQDYLSGRPIPHPAFNSAWVSPPSDLDVKFIVWFHTESHRDRCSDVTTIYSAYRDFFQHSGCAYMIVGGAGDLAPNWPEFFSPVFCIPSWRQHILHCEVPWSNTLWTKHGIFEADIDQQKKLELIEQDLVIRRLLDQSDDFPDGAHPGIRPHNELLGMVLELIQDIKS